jgi:hypothetical protein
MEQFDISQDDINALVKQYPKIEKILVMRAQHGEHSPMTTVCNYLIELTNDLKDELPSGPAPSKPAMGDDEPERAPTKHAPSSKGPRK